MKCTIKNICYKSILFSTISCLNLILFIFCYSYINISSYIAYNKLFILYIHLGGKRRIQRDISYYNLDMIISVGYRVNSRKATTTGLWVLNRQHPCCHDFDDCRKPYGRERCNGETGILNK